jgi:hypothetical protein
MDKKKLKKIRQEIRSLRAGSANVRRRQLISVAKKLGRQKSDRGKEPTFISNVFPNLRPISIPSHPGSMPRYTVENILDQFEDDIFHWQQELDKTHDLTNTDE